MNLGKFFIVSLFGLCLLGTPNVILATSGACSYHGGVNCSFGAGPTGGAICSDGTESSVSYYAMQECTVPVYYGCRTQDEYNLKANLCEQAKANDVSYCAKEANFYAITGGVAPPCPSQQPRACIDANICLNEVNAISAERQVNIQNQATQVQSNQNSICVASYGVNAEAGAGGKCKCKSDYFFDSTTGKCEVPTRACFDNLGPYYRVTSNSCACKDHYIPDSTGKCVSNKVSYPVSATLYRILEDGSSCRNPTLSQDEYVGCVKYQGNPDLYELKLAETVSIQPVVVSPQAETKKVETPLATEPLKVAPKKKVVQIITQPVATSSVEVNPVFAKFDALLGSTTPQKLPEVRPWYHWLNPFSWFR